MPPSQPNSEGEALADRGERDEYAVRWLVSGRVQGVGFRWFVERAATECGVRGDVHNLSDGRVEIRAGGTEEALERLLARVRTGPRGSRVEEIVASDWTADGMPPGFEVRR